MKDFVFVDEMGINLALAREYGRAAPGERVRETRPRNNSTTVSCQQNHRRHAVVVHRQQLHPSKRYRCPRT